MLIVKIVLRSSVSLYRQESGTVLPLRKTTCAISIWCIRRWGCRVVRRSCSSRPGPLSAKEARLTSVRLLPSESLQHGSAKRAGAVPGTPTGTPSAARVSTNQSHQLVTFMQPREQSWSVQDSGHALFAQAYGIRCAFYFFPLGLYATLAELQLARAHRQRIQSLPGTNCEAAQTCCRESSWFLARCHGLCRVRTLCGAERLNLTIVSVMQKHPVDSAAMSVAGMIFWRFRVLHDLRHFFVFKRPHIWHMTAIRQGDVVMFRVDIYFVPPSCMETQLKSQDVTPRSEATPEAVEAKKPLKILRIEDISASIFERIVESGGELAKYHNVSFSRSYIGENGKRMFTKSFSPSDLSKVVELAVQAHDYISALDTQAVKA